MVHRMEQPDRLMTWEEMVEKYPGKWVIVKKTKGNASTVEEGIVKYVATDDEMPDIWVRCLRAKCGYDKFRTTLEPFMGVVDGVNFEITAEEIFSNED